MILRQSYLDGTSVCVDVGKRVSASHQPDTSVTDWRHVDWWLVCRERAQVLHSPAGWTLQQHRALAAPAEHGEADLFNSPGHVPPVVFVDGRQDHSAVAAA